MLIGSPANSYSWNFVIPGIEIRCARHIKKLPTITIVGSFERLGERFSLLFGLFLFLRFFGVVDEASSAPVGFRIVSGEVIDANAARFAASRMNELAISDIHSDMGDPRSCRMEEDEVSRLQVAARDRFACMELLRRGARKIDSFATVDILGEARAVERSRAGGSEAVGGASISVCSSHDFVRGGGSFRFRSNSIGSVGGGSVIVG